MYAYLFLAMWLVLLVYWWRMAGSDGVNELRESGPARLVRLLAILLALALLCLPSVPLPWLDRRFLPPGMACVWIGLAVTAGGLVFAAWARHHLGNNWSQAVTIKQGQELVTSGPYAIVRHPIYAGLLFGFIGMAVALGELRGILAVGLVFAVLWAKLRLEEEWIRGHFGESYDAYSRRVKVLLPYLI